MAKKVAATKENVQEEKTIAVSPEVEELKKQLEDLKVVNEELKKVIAVSRLSYIEYVVRYWDCQRKNCCLK